MESLCVALIIDEYGQEECYDFLQRYEKKLTHVQFLIPPEFYAFFKSLKKLQFKPLPVKGIKGWGLINAMISIKELHALGIFVHPELYEMSSHYLMSLITGCQDHKIPCFIDRVGAQGLLYLVEQQQLATEEKRIAEQLAIKEKAAIAQFLQKEQQLHASPIHWFETDTQESKQHAPKEAHGLTDASMPLSDSQTSVEEPSTSLHLDTVQNECNAAPIPEEPEALEDSSADNAIDEPLVATADPVPLEAPATLLSAPEESPLEQHTSNTNKTIASKSPLRKQKRNFKKRVVKKSK